jgi:hypothetical protein
MKSDLPDGAVAAWCLQDEPFERMRIAAMDCYREMLRLTARPIIAGC